MFEFVNKVFVFRRIAEHKASWKYELFSEHTIVHKLVYISVLPCFFNYLHEARAARMRVQLYGFPWCAPCVSLCVNVCHTKLDANC